MYSCICLCICCHSRSPHLESLQFDTFTFSGVVNSQPKSPQFKIVDPETQSNVAQSRMKTLCSISTYIIYGPEYSCIHPLFVYICTYMCVYTTHITSSCLQNDFQGASAVAHVMSYGASRDGHASSTTADEPKPKAVDSWRQQSAKRAWEEHHHSMVPKQLGGLRGLAFQNRLEEFCEPAKFYNIFRKIHRRLVSQTVLYQR